MTEDKQKIIELFRNNVFKKTPDVKDKNVKHDGAKGDWLHLQFGQEKDSKNEADFWGYECKNHTSNKTTWGDWTPNYILFHDDSSSINRDEFIKTFGLPNENNRFSWSGKEVPSRHEDISEYGQYMYVTKESDIEIRYDYFLDKRKNKEKIIPKNLRIKNLLLAKWIGYESNNDTKKTSLEKKVTNKFNQKGWFKCVLGKDGSYEKIIFGNPITFETWIKYVKSGDIYFDSGMREDSPKPYSPWRSSNKFWEKLVIDTFPKDE